MSLKSKAVPGTVQKTDSKALFSLTDGRSNCCKISMSPKQIVAIRKALKLTQAKLAEKKIGAQRPTVARWETGRNMPKGAYLKALEALAAKSKVKIRTVRKKPVARKSSD